MSAKNEGKDPTPGELNFVRLELLKGDDPLFAKWVTKRKGTKIQDRLIVIGKYRIFSLKKTLTGKKQVQRVGHYFDLVEIYSSDVDKVVFKFKDFEIDIKYSTAGTEVIHIVRTAFQKISYSFAEYAMPKITLIPSERGVQQLPSIDPGPAHGLIATYEAYCDYYGQFPCKEFVKYITDLSDAGNRELAIDKCPGIERKENPIDFTPIRAALRHNTFFTAFGLKGIPRRDISEKVADTMMHNVTITKLSLSSVAVQDTAVFHLGNALKRNQHSALTDLDLSGNPDIREKGFTSLAEGLQPFEHSLSRLNLAACKMSEKSAFSILQALCYGKNVASHLQELDMSFNTFASLGSSQIANWFVQQESAQHLKYLYLADTKLDVCAVMKSLRNGGVNSLIELDVSVNKIDLNAAVALGSVIESNPNMNVLNVSFCGLQSQPLEAILSAITKTDAISNFSVNISGNGELGPTGAATVASCIRGSRNIMFLVARACGFKKEGLTKIVEQLGENTSLRALDLSFNFRAGTSSKMMKLMQQLAATIQKHPCLESLSLGGDGNKNAIGKEIQPIIDCLTQNPNLTELDICGNKLGDQLAISLCDALRQNRKLKSLKWDRNGINMGGWQALSNVLSQNKTLISVPTPVVDIDRALKETKNKDQLMERIKEAMEKIRSTLKENANGQKYESPYQQFTRNRNFVLSAVPASPNNAGPAYVDYSHQSYPVDQAYGSEPIAPPIPAYETNYGGYGQTNYGSYDYEPPAPPVYDNTPSDYSNGYEYSTQPETSYTGQFQEFDDTYESEAPPPPPPPF